MDLSVARWFQRTNSVHVARVTPMTGSRSWWRRRLRRLPPLQRRDQAIAALEAQLRETRGELRRARNRVERLSRQRDRAVERARRLREERAQVRRQLRRLTPRTDLEFVFIVTYGRSGSTLLQGILNSIPGYHIRGENGQLLRDLYDVYRSARHWRARQRRWLRDHPEHEEVPPTNAWYGMDRLPLARLNDDIRRMFVDRVLRPRPEDRVVGFKEIRWEGPDLEPFVDWLRSVFPGVRFIINTRNLDDVRQSAWWRRHEDALTHLREVDRQLRELASRLGSDAYLVHYDDYVGDPATLSGLFEWLGEEPDLAKIHNVLSVQHSYAPRTSLGPAT